MGHRKAEWVEPGRLEYFGIVPNEGLCERGWREGRIDDGWSSGLFMTTVRVG